jgi:membrane protease YdiL (CAAX protease family)
MQTYLKTKPAWMQLLLFMGMAFGLAAVFLLLGSLILAQLTGVSMVALSDTSQWNTSNPNMLTAIRGMILLQFLGVFLVPSLLFAYFSDPKPGQYLGLKAPSNAGYWIIGILIMFIAIPLVEYTGTLNKQVNFGAEIQQQAQRMEKEAAKTIQFMLGTHTVSNLLINLIFIAAFAGIGEELFFRGVLQRIFIKSTRSPWAGIIITAFIFSFFHFQFFGFVPRLLLGVLLGAIYWYSGSLWPAIIAHFLYDAFIIVLAYFNPKMVTDQDASMIDTSYLWIGALISAVLVGAMLWWMNKNSTNSFERVYAGDKIANPDKDFTF